MTSHIYHDRANGEVLQDGCPRCEEHAKRPLRSLDRDHLSRLVNEALEVEYGEGSKGYRSIADATAARHLLPVLSFAAEYHDLVERYRERSKHK